MKIEHLAIIFVLIILPIDIVLGLYLNAQIDTVRNQATYDSRLVNCVYDAMKIYESNSIIDTENDIVTAKMKNIEASASTFLSSLQTSFGYSGYKASVMQEYVPAVVYTMYDGYYIYSKFNNTLSQKLLDPNIENTYKDLETYEDIKSYVFYSCRYYRDNGTTSKDDDDDFVITYSLDNYISIQGILKGKYYIDDSGYLIDGITYDSVNNGYEYDGIVFKEDGKISEKNTLAITSQYSNSEEYLYMDKVKGYELYKYVKLNGTKYYLNEDEHDDSNCYIFHFINGEKIRIAEKNKERKKYDKYANAIKENKSAYYYYKEAYEFTNRVRKIFKTEKKEKLDSNGNIMKDSAGNTMYEDKVTQYGLSNLKASDAYYWDSSKNAYVQIKDFGNYLVFKKDSNLPIQDSNSAFNQHRKAVIRYTIETNLSAAIAGFSSFSEQSIEYALPKISEEDWENVENNVCIIGFLQGLDIGTKKYNGYAVCVNSLTKEYVDENSIYLIAGNEYHRANATDIPIGTTSMQGVYKIDFERHYITNKDENGNEETFYYYPKLYVDGTEKKIYTGSYTSIVSQTAVNTQFEDMYKYMRTLGDSENKSYHNTTSDNYDNLRAMIKKTYYTALARERYGSYKINHDIGFKYYLDNYNY